MTFKKFFILGFGLAIFTAIIKLVFLSIFDLQNVGLVYIVAALIGLISIGFSRRIGVITYLEAAFVAIAWTAFSGLMDLVLLSLFIGLESYQHLYFWFFYLVTMVCVIAFHKKRHVEIRKQMAERGH